MTDELKTEEHFLLYIDFLGSKKRIANDEDKWLNVIHTLYTEAVKYTYSLTTEERIKFVPKENVSIHIFSDNIAISVKADTHNIFNQNILSFLFYVASYIQAHALMKYRWLVRGVITSGNLYASVPNTENPAQLGLIWGTALTRAYKIESETAIYPRIVLDKKTHEKYSWDNYFTITDTDGTFFVDYFYLQMKSNMDFNRNHSNFYETCRILDAINLEGERDERVIQKVEWTRTYIKRVQSYFYPIGK